MLPSCSCQWVMLCDKWVKTELWKCCHFPPLMQELQTSPCTATAPHYTWDLHQSSVYREFSGCESQTLKGWQVPVSSSQKTHFPSQQLALSGALNHFLVIGLFFPCATVHTTYFYFSRWYIWTLCEELPSAYSWEVWNYPKMRHAIWISDPEVSISIWTTWIWLSARETATGHSLPGACLGTLFLHPPLFLTLTLWVFIPCCLQLFTKQRTRQMIRFYLLNYNHRHFLRWCPGHLG